MANSVFECQVDSSPTKVTVGGLAYQHDLRLFLAGLPGPNLRATLNDSTTCFPDVGNFSGCVADLEMNFVSSSARVLRLNTTLARQFGDVFETCTEAKDSIVSITDKNSKVSLRMRDDMACNTSFEFQIRTKESRAFVGKIMNQILTALFFLEKGNMKVSVRFEGLNKHKGNSFVLTSSGKFLANSQWHKVTFIAAEKTGVILLIDGGLKSSYKATNTLMCVSLENSQESYSTIRFGRTARKYPSFTGCLRDVYVNKHALNFSHHGSSKGILVGKCHDLFMSDNESSFKEQLGESLTVIRSSPDSFVYTKSFDGQAYAYEVSIKPTVASNGSSNTLDGYNGTQAGAEHQPRSNFRFDKAYPISIALSVGLLMVFVVLVYIFGAGLKSRLQNCRNERAVKENDESKPSTMVQVGDKDGSSYQPPVKCSKNVCTSVEVDQERHNKSNPNALKGNGRSWYQEIYRSARRIDQNPMKVWEDRFLNKQASKDFDSNLLPVPQLHHSHIHQTVNTRSREKVSNDVDNVLGSVSILPSDDFVTLQKRGFSRDDFVGHCPSGIGGKTVSSVVSSPSPKWLKKAYTGHESLPKSKKASSLSWAYGARFVRHGHESSDTDCSEINKVTRVQSRNRALESGKGITISPRKLKVLESSEDEQETCKGSKGNYLGRGRRLRTFTEESYKLHSLKEEDREIDLDPRLSFTSSRLKVYHIDTYSARGWNRSTSFAEARVRYEDTVTVSNQIRSLDGYTSSCPESIHCLSEKEDKRVNIRHSKRLTTHYF